MPWNPRRNKPPGHGARGVVRLHVRVRTANVDGLCARQGGEDENKSDNLYFGEESMKRKIRFRRKSVAFLTTAFLIGCGAAPHGVADTRAGDLVFPESTGGLAPSSLYVLPEWNILHARGGHLDEEIVAGGEAAWREWVRAYLACMAFVDDRIGKVLEGMAVGDPLRRRLPVPRQN